MRKRKTGSFQFFVHLLQAIRCIRCIKIGTVPTVCCFSVGNRADVMPVHTTLVNWIVGLRVNNRDETLLVKVKVKVAVDSVL